MVVDSGYSIGKQFVRFVRRLHVGPAANDVLQLLVRRLVASCYESMDDQAQGASEFLRR